MGIANQMKLHVRRSITPWLAAVAMIPMAVPADAGPTAPRDPNFGDGGVSAFYRWDGAKPRKAGALLRQEAVGDGFFTDHASLTRRILYSTTDGRFGAGVIPASSLLYLPRGDTPKGGWPLLVWGHGTMGIADVCAPSWQKPLARDGYFIDAWLQKGYAVVAPDYQGLGTPGVHPYLSREGEGYSVLDAARAALAAYPAQISNRVIFAGQSQGSGAVVSASYLAPAYAPGVHLLGTIATGLALTAAMQPGEVDALTTMAESPRLNIMRIMAGGTRPGSPSADVLLSDKGKRIADAAQTHCSRALSPIVREIGLTPDNAYSIPPREAAAMLLPMEVPPTPLKVPLFVGTGLADALIPPDRQFRGAEAMCRTGTSLFWHGYEGVSHNGSLIAALKDGQAFAADLLAGRKPAANCRSIKAPGPLQPVRKDMLFND